jgi:hypothetical protein
MAWLTGKWRLFLAILPRETAGVRGRHVDDGLVQARSFVDVLLTAGILQRRVSVIQRGVPLLVEEQGGVAQDVVLVIWTVQVQESGRKHVRQRRLLRYIPVIGRQGQRVVARR